MIELLRKLLGDALTDDMVQQIEAYLAENYVEKAEYDKVLAAQEEQGNSSEQFKENKEKDGGNAASVSADSGLVAEQNADADKTAAVRAEIEKEVQAEYEERLYAIEFDYAVNIALLQIGVVDLDLVKVKLDLTKLSMNEKGEISGLEEQVEEICQQFPMLFVDNADLLPANFYGLKPLVGQKNYSAITREDINNMNYKERLALLKSNPSLYHALIG